MAENILLENVTSPQVIASDSAARNEEDSLWKKLTGLAVVVSLTTSIDLQEPNKDLINSITNPEIQFSPITSNLLNQEVEYIDDAPMIPKRLFSMKAKLGKIRKLKFEPVEDENGFI
ncbi:MAG TPA: hypothetical protein PKV80_29210 [Leptospiraceae bacterium]|nr:hypothetical protein [Leptospiraceae bacterium]